MFLRPLISQKPKGVSSRLFSGQQQSTETPWAPQGLQPPPRLYSPPISGTVTVSQRLPAPVSTSYFNKPTISVSSQIVSSPLLFLILHIFSLPSLSQYHAIHKPTPTDPNIIICHRLSKSLQWLSSQSLS